MSGVVETVEVDPTQAVGRLLPEGWRVVERSGCEAGTILRSGGPFYWSKFVPHGDIVTVVVEGDES